MRGDRLKGEMASWVGEKIGERIGDVSGEKAASSSVARGGAAVQPGIVNEYSTVMHARTLVFFQFLPKSGSDWITA